MLNRPTSATDPTGQFLWNGIRVDSTVLGGDKYWATYHRLPYEDPARDGDRAAPSPPPIATHVGTKQPSGILRASVSIPLLGLITSPTKDTSSRPEGARLYAETAIILQPYFPDLDLSKVRIHTFMPDFVDPGARAYTSGYDIYFKPDLYDPTTPQGVGEIAHELEHTRQYQALGGLSLRMQYAMEYLENRRRGMDEAAAYREISFERTARAIQTTVQRQLEEKGFGR